MNLNIKSQIISYAKNTLGIDAIGFSNLQLKSNDLNNYYEYLESNNYRNMTWMASRKNLRENPKALMEDAKSIIVLGINYHNEKKIKDYKISTYADQQSDYHNWVYDKIKQLSAWMEEEFHSKQRYFVDSAPILEKIFAKYTNIGWQGKHTCIVSKEFGSWLFLGTILTSLDLPPDSPHKDFCGNCKKCIDACPTSALTPYKLDVNKCISYLTIEHKAEIQQNIHKKMDTNIFGCDECMKACHFNKWQKKSSHLESNENESFPEHLIDFLKLNQKEFNNIFKNTPLKRTGYMFILRNVLIALNNSTHSVNFNTAEIIKYVIPLTSYPNLEIQGLASLLLTKQIT